MEGVIKWWSKERGYGFIECEDEENIFAYIDKNEIKEINFEENNKIQFEIVKTFKGNHLIIKG